MGARGQLGSLSTVWTPGLELGSSGLVAPLLTEPCVWSVLRTDRLRGLRMKLSSRGFTIWGSALSSGGRGNINFMFFFLN